MRIAQRGYNRDRTRGLLLNPSRTLARLRTSLFVLTGLALPFHAFPVATAFGKPLGLATICAALFVLTSLPILADGVLRLGPAIFLAGCVFLPLLVLLPPRPESLAVQAFTISYAHWILIIGFFFCALHLDLSERARRRLLQANVIAGIAVALFAFYQVLGFPRGWPATGTMLISFQREPLRLDATLGYVRPTSIFLEPAWMGGYLVWVLVLAVGLLPKLRAGSRVALLAGSALILGAILASVSWGAYADLFVAGIATAATLAKRRIMSRRLAVAAAGLIAVLLLLGSLSPPGRRILGAVRARWSRLTTTSLAGNQPRQPQEDSIRIRFENALCTARLVSRYPFRGIGLGQFAVYARSEEGTRERDPREAACGKDAWCGWCAIAAEVGGGGPLLLLGAFLLVLRRGRGARPIASPTSFVAPALVAFAAVAQIHTASYIDLWWWYPLSLASIMLPSRTEPETEVVPAIPEARL